MRIALICLCFLLVGINTYAANYFPYNEIKDLYVYQVDKEQGMAWVCDRGGNEAVVTINDTIGFEEKLITVIDENSISVRFGDTITKIPVLTGAIFSQDALSNTPPLPFYPE